ncbi:hypothetical protein R3P38DRAFT_2912677 [Favolaschia claudopus]|uniref:Uncharacterized protein n=1 Tax=Favolaschia claudopus TaxID=2862362 RepID=A0AAW0CBE1_9AGAR
MNRYNFYGEGAPQGDPFNPHGYGPPPPANGNIGRGPPPTPSRHGRSVSFESPVATHRRAGPNARFTDPATTPTPNRIAYSTQRVSSSQNGPGTDQLLYMLIRKIDTVINDARTLQNSVDGLTERVASLEVGGRPVPAGRYRGPQRGRSRIGHAPSTRRSTSRRSAALDESIDPALRPALSSDDESEPATDTATESDFFAESEETPDAESHEIGEPLVIDHDMLTESERNAVRRRITKIFGEVCNVSNEWPEFPDYRVNPITNQQYPTPNFDADVTDVHNCAIFQKVALRAQRVLVNKTALPKSMGRFKTMNEPIAWDLDFTIECAKGSFRSIKAKVNKQRTVEGRAKAGQKEKNDRRNQRRVTKSEQISKVSAAVAEEQGMDAQFICDSTIAEYLSDEVSGPDSDVERPETREDWVFRLATLAELPTDPSSLKTYQILEVLVPGWRDEAYSEFVHALERRYQLKGKGKRGNGKQYGLLPKLFRIGLLLRSAGA